MVYRNSRLSFALRIVHYSFSKSAGKSLWDSNFSCRLTVSHPKEAQGFLSRLIVARRETRKVHTGFYLTEI
ncbi:MAG TPA: hypothetical protein DD393_00130 [Ruminococcaceae bacterium]|nr:hypothetical protein [Oscillospiraceae bacterium]